MRVDVTHKMYLTKHNHAVFQHYLRANLIIRY